LAWDAAVQRQNGPFTMLDAQSVRIQVADLGLQVSYRGENGKQVEVALSTPLPDDGQVHHYRMERTRREYRLTIDSQPLLAGVPAGHAPHWDFVRFGVTRADQSPGGTLRLDNVEYLQRFFAD